MRTIIDIPPEQLQPLDALCEEEGVSRAEMVRRGIDMVLEKKNKSRKKVTLDDVFGMCKDSGEFGDGLEYQLKMRAEWDDRDRAIDEWRAYQKLHPIILPVIEQAKKPE